LVTGSCELGFLVLSFSTFRVSSIESSQYQTGPPIPLWHCQQVVAPLVYCFFIILTTPTTWDHLLSSSIFIIILTKRSSLQVECDYFLTLR